VVRLRLRIGRGSANGRRGFARSYARANNYSRAALSWNRRHDRFAHCTACSPPFRKASGPSKRRSFGPANAASPRKNLGQPEGVSAFPLGEESGVTGDRRAAAHKFSIIY
jgi:hypothetical protein